MTAPGISAEIFFSPGAYPEAGALYDFSVQILSGGIIYGDRTCNAYAAEDDLEQSTFI